MSDRDSDFEPVPNNKPPCKKKIEKSHAIKKKRKRSRKTTKATTSTSTTATTASTSITTSKRTRKKSGSATTPAPSPLPPLMSRILLHFDILEKATLFLDNRSAPLKVDTVCTVVSSLLRQPFTRDDVGIVWRFTQGLWDLAWQAQFAANQWSNEQQVDLCVRLDETQEWKGKGSQVARHVLVEERLRKWYEKNQHLGISPLPMHTPPHPSTEEEHPKCPVDPIDVRPRNVNEMLKHVKTLPYYENQISWIEIFPLESSRLL